MTSAPQFVPSTWNWTPTIPVVSEAVAETATVEESVELIAGVMIDTVGAVLLPTVTETAAEVDWFPAASRATAVSV